MYLSTLPVNICENTLMAPSPSLCPSYTKCDKESSVPVVSPMFSLDYVVTEGLQKYVPGWMYRIIEVQRGPLETQSSEHS